MIRVSEEPTPFAVHCFGFVYDMCDGGDPIYLTEDEYIRQLSRPDDVWECPKCGCEAWFDDELYEEALT